MSWANQSEKHWIKVRALRDGDQNSFILRKNLQKQV